MTIEIFRTKNNSFANLGFTVSEAYQTKAKPSVLGIFYMPLMLIALRREKSCRCMKIFTQAKLKLQLNFRKFSYSPAPELAN